jgi:hypothetical protein
MSNPSVVLNTATDFLSVLQTLANLSQAALEQLTLHCLTTSAAYVPEAALAEEAVLQQTLLQRAELLNTLLERKTNPLQGLTTEETNAWKQFIHQHEQLGQLLQQRHHHLEKQLEQGQQQQRQLQKYHSQATLY